MGRPTKSGRSKHDLQIDILNRLTIKPSLKAAVGKCGVNPATVFHLDSRIASKTRPSPSLGSAIPKPSPPTFN